MFNDPMVEKETMAHAQATLALVWSGFFDIRKDIVPRRLASGKTKRQG
jgi:uncharacterized membrane protein